MIRPPPTPLSVGERVLCTVTESDDTPHVAVVVELDSEYQEASAQYIRRNPPPPSLPYSNDTSLPFQPIPLSHTSAKRRRIDSTSHPSSPTNSSPDHQIALQPIADGRVYVHFEGRDRRLDRWCLAVEVTRASPRDIQNANTRAKVTPLSSTAVVPDVTTENRRVTRARQRAFEEINPTSEKNLANPDAKKMEELREELTKVRNISSIVLGDYVLEAWYFSPFPVMYKVDMLYMCGKCLKYLHTSQKYLLHCSKCEWEHPPGFRIYHDSKRNLSVYEISAVINPAYCQCLCLLGKLFLDHKTLFFDTSPFLFYVLTINGELAGYFSKEHPIVRSDHNLACILTLPHHQKKGVGRFLISFSYELTKREGKTAAPERPLSDLGQVSYRSYWAHAVLEYLETRDNSRTVSVNDISQWTGILKSDVNATLKHLNLVSIWKQETYATTDAQQITAARKKVSAPRIPFISSKMLDSVYTLEPQRSSTPVPRTPTTGTARKRMRSHGKSGVKSKRTPVLERRRYPRENDADFRTRKIREILQSVGPERAIARMNKEGGMTKASVQMYAKEVGMTPKQFRKRLMSEAREILGTANDGSIHSSSDGRGNENPSLGSSDTPELVSGPSRPNGNINWGSWSKDDIENDFDEIQENDRFGQEPDCRVKGQKWPTVPSMLPSKEENGSGPHDSNSLEEVTPLGRNHSNGYHDYRASRQEAEAEDEVIVVDH